MLEYTTKLSKGGPNSTRSVIPQEILKLLELEQGDSLHWKVIIEDKITVEVEKAKPSQK
ncbi:hypothetical protein [Methanobrevibacter sp.]|uniref:hypothetical protein n=1 Tax=Methanobrevibacter sp. TaxID=66852 RepID=UPI003869B2AC